MFLKSIFLLALASPVFGSGHDWSKQNSFRVDPSDQPFASFDNNVNVFFQYDGNFVVYLHGTVNTADAVWYSYTGIEPSGADCTKISCELVFQTDGDLVIYQNNVAVWNTGTANRGAKWWISATHPYVKITDSLGDDIWTATRECIGSECTDF